MDKQARNILFKTYWSSGWIDRAQRHTAPEDFEYAKSKGLMFDPVSISHDDCLAQTLALREGIPASLPARAFLSSLSARRLDWRSGLASYQVAQALAPHAYAAAISGESYAPDGSVANVSHVCGVCRDAAGSVVAKECYEDLDLNVMNFERIKWGGVRHGMLEYTWFDLRELAAADVPAPTAQDIALFREILAVAASCDPKDGPGALEQKLKAVVASSKSERQMLIDILACAGVLRPLSYDRRVPGRSDWRYAAAWRGEDGYSEDAVQRCFGDFL